MTNFRTAKYDETGSAIDDPNNIRGNAFSAPTSVMRQVLKTDALVKWFGPTDANGYTFGETNALGHKLPFDWTTSIKAEMEAPFSAVKVVVWNRMDNALNMTGVLGVSEVMGAATDAEASAPRINGVTYQQMAPANTVNGFYRIKWSGANQVTVPAANAAHQIGISDRIALSSVPRAAGESSTRPALICRLFTNGFTASVLLYGWTVDSPWVPSNLTIASADAMSINGNRRIVQRGGGADYTTDANVAVGVPANVTPNACLEFGFIVSFNRPVISVWGCGDSITSMPTTTVQSNYINNWGMRACAEVSTPDIPVVWANFGTPSANVVKSAALVRQYLVAGCPAPTVLLVDPVSANDDGSDWNTEGQQGLQRVRDTALEWLRIARDYNIPYVIWFPLFPRNSMGLAGDNLRKQLNAEMASIAAANGVIWISMAGVGNGASPERYVTAYNSGDGIHQSEQANTDILVPALKNVLQAIAAG